MNRFDAVLPLRSRDLGRARILLRSLDRFVDGLAVLHVPVPDGEREALAAALAPIAPRGVEVRVVGEACVAPELGRIPNVGGWYKQQLLKLAIAEHVTTPLYLTLDADVVATRPVSPTELARGGRGVTHVVREDQHPRWYRRTATLLERPYRRAGITHTVTPAVLAKGAVAELAAHFDARAREGRWARGLRGLRQRWLRLRFGRDASLAPWRLFLIGALPWTEYALYFSFLEAYDRFEAYHVEVESSLYDVERSVWLPDARDAFDAWSPEPLFAGDGPPYFVVLQSNTGLPPDEVWSKLGPFLAAR